MTVRKFTYDQGEFVKIETPRDREDRKRVILYRPFKDGDGAGIVELFECATEDLAHFSRKFRVLKSKTTFV